MIQTRIRQRYDLEANWLSNDIVLLNGELAVIDCGQQIRFKVGNGISSFSQLKYVDQNQLCTRWMAIEAISQGIHAQSVPYGLAGGAYLCANANFSQALGYNVQTLSSDTYSFAWNGDDTKMIGDRYESHGKGTFNINPLSGLSGFYIGEQSLASVLNSNSSRVFIKDPSISGYENGKQSDLSVVKVTSEEYAQILSLSTQQPNTLYVISSDFKDAYGQQLKNLAPGTDLSDAVTVEQMSSTIGSLSTVYQEKGNYLTAESDPLFVAVSSTFLTAHQSLSNYYIKTETSSSSEISTALAVKADLSSIEHVVQYQQDFNGIYTAVTIGSRSSNASADIGLASFVQGSDCIAVNSYSHAEGVYTSAFSNASHTEGCGTIANNEGAHAEGGNTSAFGYYSHAEGGWTSTGAYAMGAHAEGGFTKADGPISHVEGIKATSEISDFQSFVWQGTDVMPNELTDITPSTWDEYKAHGPGTFNINPVGGISGVYIGETRLVDIIKDDYITIIEFDDGTTSSFNWSGEINRQTMIDAGLYDENENSWIQIPVNAKIGTNVTVIGVEAFPGCSGLTSVTIPNSVTSIGNNAFESCSGLDNTALNFITIDKGDWIKLFDEYGLEYYKSNQISDDESTSMSVLVSAPAEGQAAIKLKTSSEESYDILRLTFDGQELTSMSGILDWQEIPITVPSGDHVLAITYEKDGDSDVGLDCGYFAIVPGHIIVEGKTQEEAQSLLTSANVPETCKILTFDNAIRSWGIGGSGGSGYEQIEYTDLLNLVDNGNLVPGTMYRITDYVTMIDQPDCSSAMHPFDLVVTALTESQLDENARATIHDGDTYFAAKEFHIQEYQAYLEYRRVPLESWELKYCIHNDKTRFRFADETNGKGVIYWMKDEFNNEAPYDFKNVLFKRYEITAITNWNESDWGQHDLIGTYGLPTYTVEVDDQSYIWCYTFNGSDYTDYGFSEPYDFSGWHIAPTQAVQSQFSGAVERLQECSENLIGTWQESIDDYTLMAFKLPNIVFQCALTEMPIDQLPFLKIGICMRNRFGKNCFDNTFGYYCYNNTFGNYCYNNTFGNAYNNTFDDNSNSNTFGNYCYNNTFGKDCDNNTFGNDCDNNTFGNDCDNNTFGNNCSFNALGDSCIYIKFASTNTSDPSSANGYYKFITIDSGNQYILLNCTQSTYDGHEYKNVRILLGVNNSTDYKTITDINVNQSFCTTYQPADSQVIAV